MGFKPPRKIYKLKFTDPDMDGLEVVAGSVPLGSLLDLANAEGSATEELNQMVELFGSVLQSWNVEDDADQPVPATTAGLLTQDADFVLMLVGLWSDAIKGVTPPLSGGSSSGVTSGQELSIPMIPLGDSSESLAS